MKKVVSVYGALSLFLLSACGSGSGDAPEAKEPAVENTGPATQTAPIDDGASRISYVETYLKPSNINQEGTPPLIEQNPFSVSNLTLALEQLSRSDGNTIRFPFDQLAAANQLALGAEGDTLAQLKTTFHTKDVPTNTYHQAHGEWVQQIIEQLGNSGERQSEVWAQVYYKFSTNYFNNQIFNHTNNIWGLDYFYYPSESGNIISDWINTQIDGNHGYDLTRYVDKDTRLVSGQYLGIEASWAPSLNVEAIPQERFMAEDGLVYEVPAMNISGNLKHVTTDQYQAHLLPLDNNTDQSNLALLVLMPNSGEFEAVKTQLNDLFWNQLLQNVVEGDTSVTLPEFTLAEDVKDLAPPLAMDKTNADFSSVNFSGYLYNSLFSQKGEFKLSNAGANSNSATITQLSAKENEPDTVWASDQSINAVFLNQSLSPIGGHVAIFASGDFVCYDEDPAKINPFMFALVESNSSAILNIGQVVTPTDPTPDALKVPCETDYINVFSLTDLPAQNWDTSVWGSLDTSGTVTSPF